MGRNGDIDNFVKAWGLQSFFKPDLIAKVADKLDAHRFGH